MSSYRELTTETFRAENESEQQLVQTIITLQFIKSFFAEICNSEDHSCSH